MRNAVGGDSRSDFSSLPGEEHSITQLEENNFEKLLRSIAANKISRLIALSLLLTSPRSLSNNRTIATFIGIPGASETNESDTITVQASNQRDVALRSQHAFDFCNCRLMRFDDRHKSTKALRDRDLLAIVVTFLIR